MPYGTVNADVIGTSVANTSLGAGNASIMKNRIINGAMVIDQRNGGAAVTPTNGQYLVDRWVFGATQASKFTSGQGSGGAPVGFSNYYAFTSASSYSLVSTDIFRFIQRIEGFNTSDLGWGTANAKTVTLSFVVYSSLTGTFGGYFANSAGNRTYVFTYSIPVANTWTTISVTIPGDTTGTWVGATNGIGIELGFSLGSGSTYSTTAGSWNGAFYSSATGATSVVGTNGATFYITGVQLEVGSSATGYEYRMYQQELALCQRYCFASDAYACVSGIADSSSTVWMHIKQAVTMRTAPTYSVTSGNVSISDDYVSDFSAASPSLTGGNNGVEASRIRISGFAGLTYARFYGGIGGTAKLIGSSEL